MKNPDCLDLKFIVWRDYVRIRKNMAGIAENPVWVDEDDCTAELPVPNSLFSKSHVRRDNALLNLDEISFEVVKYVYIF